MREVVLILLAIVIVPSPDFSLCQPGTPELWWLSSPAVPRPRGAGPGGGGRARPGHFYASALIMHRETVAMVQKRLGHAEPSITLDTYTHLWPAGEDTTRAVMVSAFGDRPSVPSPPDVVSTQVRGVTHR